MMAPVWFSDPSSSGASTSSPAAVEEAASFEVVEAELDVEEVEEDVVEVVVWVVSDEVSVRVLVLEPMVMASETVVISAVKESVTCENLICDESPETAVATLAARFDAVPHPNCEYPPAKTF